MSAARTSIFAGVVSLSLFAACAPGCHPAGDASPPAKKAEPAAPAAVRSPAPAELPAIRLPEAPGVGSGTPVTARGIRIGEITAATLEGREVVLAGSLDEGQSPAFAAGACARVKAGEGGAVVALELGAGDAGAPEVLVLCPPAKSPGAGPPIELRGRVPEVETAASGKGTEASKPKAKIKLATRECGDGLSFATVSVTPVSPRPVHLPRGGWRAEIRFENRDDKTVQIDPVSSATFIDKDGRALPVATLPGSPDWFMPFELPPNSAKLVFVTFHDDGRGKPWVYRLKYGFNCKQRGSRDANL